MGHGVRGGAKLVAGMAFGFGAARAALDRPPEADLHGQVALVTGGSRGLGLAISRELAAHGCRLVICARDATELEAARAGLERSGAEVLATACDVSDRTHVETMVAAVTRHYGQIDILVNNAGIIVVSPVANLTHADFERVLGANFWGTLNPTLAVLPGMRSRGAGRIVNITSIGGKLAMPHLLPYDSAKFAAVGFSTGLSAELAGSGITVTTVVPGLMRTGSHLHAEFGGNQEAEYRWFALGASAPWPVAISAERAARLIVRAARRGEAECIFPFTATLAARFSGALPGAAAQVLALVDRLLPEPPASPMTGLSAGAVVAEEIDSPLLAGATILGRRAAEAYNQIP
jgi:NAD(P)-dependent dehydrogenase (short-subunit alcohol dehydrogenase family)